MFAVSRDHDDVVLALCLHLRQVFCHFRRWGNWEIAHDVETNITRGQRCGLVATLEITHLAHRFGVYRRFLELR